MHKIVTENIEKIQSVCKENKVYNLYAFGSVCSENFSDSSDIDLLISFQPMDYGDYADTYFNIADQFEKIFRRPVDLITDKSLSNPFFIESLNKCKVLLYEQRD